MSPSDQLSDKYVADELRREARDSSLRYSSLGVDAFLPKRPANPALKPNTRFLRALIKETNNHNASLSENESHRSREGLHKTGRLEDRHRNHERRRYASPIRRTNRMDHVPDHSPQDNHTDGRSEHRSRESSKRERYDHNKRHRSRHSGSRSPDRKRKRVSTSELSPSERGYPKERQRSRTSRARSQSPRSRTSRDEPRKRESDKMRRYHREHHRAKRSNNKDSTDSHLFESSKLHEDSDPLESIIGPSAPKPPPKPRGRGAGRSQSAMDEHFRLDYNPTEDVQPNSEEEDDWEQALEAMRDRERWKQLGASRLREAGFSSRDIKKWEQNGADTEEDIHWKRAGEGREWDRGKVLSDGYTQTTPNWAKP